MTVEIVWGEPGSDPALTFERSGDDVRLVVDARLSRGRVRAACAELGVDGDAAFDAWARRVGLEAGTVAGYVSRD